MNVARLKALLWIFSLGVAGYLGWFVYDFLDRKEELSRGVTKDEQKQVLESVEVPEPPKNDVVAYDKVRAVYHSMDWTGAPPPVITDTQEDKGPVETPKTPVSDLLAIILIQVDTRRPENSLAYVRFKDPSLEAASKNLEDIILRPGENLGGKYAHVEVEEITVEGVKFKFTDDEERESELVPALTYPGDRVDIVAVGPEGVVQPSTQDSLIERKENYVPWRPEESVQIRKNEWQIGVVTAQNFQQNYSSILANDISYKPYKNPKTRQIEGLRVTRVRPGSVAAQHGISEGEVLKSINGYQVKSSSDAISYVKKTADDTDTWEAVFMKQGKEFTRIYKSPPPE